MSEYIISFKLPKSDPCLVASRGWRSAYIGIYCDAATTHQNDHVGVPECDARCYTNTNYFYLTITKNIYFFINFSFSQYLISVILK